MSNQLESKWITYGFQRNGVEEDMEQGVEDGKADEEVEVIVRLGIIIRDKGHNGVPCGNQVVKDHTIQDVLILQPKPCSHIEILSFETFPP